MKGVARPNRRPSNSPGKLYAGRGAGVGNSELLARSTRAPTPARASVSSANSKRLAQPVPAKW